MWGRIHIPLSNIHPIFTYVPEQSPQSLFVYLWILIIILRKIKSQWPFSPHVCLTINNLKMSTMSITSQVFSYLLTNLNLSCIVIEWMPYTPGNGFSPSFLHEDPHKHQKIHQSSIKGETNTKFPHIYSSGDCSLIFGLVTHVFSTFNLIILRSITFTSFEMICF